MISVWAHVTNLVMHRQIRMTWSTLSTLFSSKLIICIIGITISPTMCSNSCLHSFVPKWLSVVLVYYSRVSRHRYVCGRASRPTSHRTTRPSHSRCLCQTYSRLKYVRHCQHSYAFLAIPYATWLSRLCHHWPIDWSFVLNQWSPSGLPSRGSTYPRLSILSVHLYKWKLILISLISLLT